MDKEYKKIYIEEIDTSGIKEVNLVQELSEEQILIEWNGIYRVTIKSFVVSEEKYLKYQESLYKDKLKDFRDYIKHRNIGKSLLLRMIDDLVKEKVIKED